MITSQETGNTIKTLREKKGYTQKQLADRLHLSDKTISKWETGKGIPDVALFQPLAQELGVSVEELLRGDCTENRNRGANMLKGHFYYCPWCKNILYASGEGAFSCCGNPLKPLQPKQPDVEHALHIQKIEQDFYIHMNHPMIREHFIEFLAYVTADRVHILKLYPEQEAEGRFYRYGHGSIYAYCSNHQFFVQKV